MAHTKRLMVFIVTLVVTVSMAQAQHDPQRNATQAIAVGEIAKAQQEVAKGDADDSETHFVRTMIALQQGDPAGAVEAARHALDTGLPFDRLLAGPRELLSQLWNTQEFQEWSAEYQDMALLHGPMLGQVTDHGASFWVRTRSEAEVAIKIGHDVSESTMTSRTQDFTAVITVEGLSPQTHYDYQVLVDGRPQPVENPRFTTYPKQGEAASFAVVFGGGAAFNPKWEYMWDTMRDTDPLALLMLGDNVYIDQPQVVLCQQYCYYRRQSRPEWRRLVSGTATYSIYDDHDFGTNDCAGGPETDTPAWKRLSWKTFRQNWINPVYGGGESQPGCWFDFYIGDVHFILLDGRYYRDPHRGSMLGSVQKEWLKETLLASQGTFKVLASPVPWSVGIKPGSRDTWDGFPEEREDIFSFIEAERIDGVFLIAADRHRTDLRKTEREHGYDLLELESSRLTNNHTHSLVESPGWIWGYNETCSFARMQFDTTADVPHVRFECISIDGKVIHQHVLNIDDIQHP